MTARMKDRVVLRPDHIQNASSLEMAGGYDGADWTLDGFRENFRVDVTALDQEAIEFDFVGIDAAIANTFRRVLIAEVPTMAIETCFVYNNTSIIPDEVLVHRLGLVPIKADPRLFNYRADGEDWNEKNHLVFTLNAKCTKNPKAPRDASDPNILYLNSKITSAMIEWEPIGEQQQTMGDVGSVHNDILLAKLRPGQEIYIKMHCVKGLGKEHAKWSPVGTASYRLLPEVILKEDFHGKQAEKLANCFAPGVIAVDEDDEGETTARVADPRKCTMSREVMRHAEFDNKVVLQRVKDHFIFSVESTGAFLPNELVTETAQVLIAKCNNLLSKLQELNEMDTT